MSDINSTYCPRCANKSFFLAKYCYQCKLTDKDLEFNSTEAQALLHECRRHINDNEELSGNDVNLIKKLDEFLGSEG